MEEGIEHQQDDRKCVMLQSLTLFVGLTKTESTDSIDTMVSISSLK